MANAALVQTGPFGGPPDPSQARGPSRWYITATGQRIQVEQARKNDNGTCDIILPAGVTTYRRDGVPKRTAERKTDCMD